MADPGSDQTATTAQELFRAMMRDRVAPRLRALGWKGSGQSYELPDPFMWISLRFQLSRYSTAASLRFTINVSVLRKADWAAFRDEQPDLPVRPLHSRIYGPEIARWRIGDLLPSGEDVWWEIVAGDPAERVGWVADEVCAAAAGSAMPSIRRVASRG